MSCGCLDIVSFLKACINCIKLDERSTAGDAGDKYQLVSFSAGWVGQPDKGMVHCTGTGQAAAAMQP